VKQRWLVASIAAVLIALVFVPIYVRSATARSINVATTTVVSSDHLPNAAAQPDAFTAKADALSPVGWTATASDQQSTYPASNAIDGKMATIWHSQYSPTLVPLPHFITIDMHAVNNVSGLTYQPRQDTSRRPQERPR